MTEPTRPAAVPITPAGPQYALRFGKADGSFRHLRTFHAHDDLEAITIATVLVACEAPGIRREGYEVARAVLFLGIRRLGDFQVPQSLPLIEQLMPIQEVLTPDAISAARYVLGKYLAGTCEHMLQDLTSFRDHKPTAEDLARLKKKATEFFLAGLAYEHRTCQTEHHREGALIVIQVMPEVPLSVHSYQVKFQGQEDFGDAIGLDFSNSPQVRWLLAEAFISEIPNLSTAQPPTGAIH